MNKYLSALRDINKYILSFNKFLNEENKLNILQEERLNDDSYVLNLNGKTWKEIRFPRNCGIGGVYFYFGHSVTNPNKLCVYVGKASLTATTGERLWSHFKHAFDESGQLFKTSNRERFNIEAITLIPFETVGMGCFASALEEHIIIELAKEGRYELINIRGRLKSTS